ncbi:MAG TPA: SPOR domain-containing protein [Candidatus Hydrogenedentes bacterium]|nr:SPOR domain-containing protein [Candidatus Hydrogenedentota bacterium]
MARNRSVLDQDVHVTELTSFQLIIGICIALIVCLVCFLLGVVVGRSENSLHIGASLLAPNAPAESSGTNGNNAPPASSVASTVPATGQQTWPQVPTSPLVKSQAPADAVPRSTSLPAPPPRGATARDVPIPMAPPAPSPAASGMPETALKTTTQPIVTMPESTTAEIPAAKAQPPASSIPSTEKKPSPALPAPATAPAPSASTGSARSGKRFTVQVVAYDVKNREQAENYKKLLEANSDLRAEIVPSEDGKYMRVFIGDYATREEANKARQDLQKRAGFKECFVKERS